MSDSGASRPRRTVAQEQASTMRLLGGLAVLAILVIGAAWWLASAREPEMPAGAERAWQVTLPSEPVDVDSAAVPLRVRNRMGQAGETYELFARVFTPTGEASFAAATLEADNWAQFVYPADFQPEEEFPSTSLPGTYTVAWYLNEAEVARGSFTVR